ncbi:PREDICTED: diacylglycerol kinase epsilon-like [Amphimedon queenslandica]|nr:PREDICTED: diacylglycerol kinase epsilon-like [Amphimedon queenslandica]|eukprot:XP_003382870.1 PREDICTED: diacylglycerol kinase epsilon-like [Amphimedon queenslandica]
MEPPNIVGETSKTHSKNMMGPFHWVFLSVLLLTVFWVVLKLFRRRRALLFVLKHDLTRSHRWLASDFLDKPTYCNSCMQCCASGSLCEVCGLCVCPEEACLQSVATSSKTCKPLSTQPGEKTMRHAWIRGNLPLASRCFKCLTPCGTVPALADYRCLWCHNTVHEDCIDEEKGEGRRERGDCTLGDHKRLIIPPNCVTLEEKQGWRRGRSKVVVKEIAVPNTDGWKPLIVMANSKSGGKDGQAIMIQLKRLLNPIQVVDLLETPPESALEICRLIPEQPTRLMVCGGDGTVGWVLSAIDKANLPVKPCVGILPLGTGNDLARVLGWGPGYSPDDDVSEVLREMEHAQQTLMDRWKVVIESQKRKYLGLQRDAKVLTMNNYLGIGCDAGVALNFHRHRESRPDLFTSRLINKAWYLGFGARDVIEQSCKNLPNKIELYIDDVPVKLPDLEGIVILNINSWSSGCSVWSPSDEWGPSRIDDKMVELVGLYSSFHIGKIQMSVAEPLKIGQAKSVKVVLKESVPIQVDGEPWQQSPSVISINHNGQANMLKKVSS